MNKKDYGTVKVKLKGVTPLLMNRINNEDLKTTTKSRMKKLSEEEEAAKGAYLAEIDGKNQLYIPSEAVYRAILNASAIHRAGKMGLKGILAGSIIIKPDKIPLGTDKYEIDTRAVVIQRNKVLKSRAKLSNWSCEFEIVYRRDFLENLLSGLETVIGEAGIRFGLLDYRPQKGGNFGIFDLESFEIVD